METNFKHVAESVRAQRAKPSAKREFSGVFADDESLKRKEGQKLNRE